MDHFEGLEEVEVEAGAQLWEREWECRDTFSMFSMSGESRRPEYLAGMATTAPGRWMRFWSMGGGSVVFSGKWNWET